MPFTPEHNFSGNQNFISEAVKEMKRFVVFVFAIAFVFVGIGTMFESVSAKFKSDEKALDIIRAARAAVGGESKLREVRGLVIAGKTTQENKNVFDTEIAIQLPDKMMKKIDIAQHGAGLPSKSDAHTFAIERKISGSDEKTFTIIGKDGEFKTADGNVLKVRKGDNGEVITEDGKKVIIHAEEIDKVIGGDGETRTFVRKPADGKELVDIQAHKIRVPHPGGERDNQVLRTTLGLLLTAPEGMDVSYTFAGEGDIDGAAANIVNAEFAGKNYKLYIGKANNLPLAISCVGHPMPEVAHFEHKVPAPADGAKDVVMFKRQVEPRAATEMLVKFSDFRDAGGIQLPYKWTTLFGDKISDVFDVTLYEINPANISERFKGQETKMRMKKVEGK